LTYETTGEPQEGYLKTFPALALSGCVDADYPLSDNNAIFGGLTFDAVNFTGKSQRGTSDADVTHFEKNSIAPNEEVPPEIPGSNWTIAAGVRFPLF